MIALRPKDGPSTGCGAGYNYYTCPPNFEGCCSVNPCAHGCPAEYQPGFSMSPEPTTSAITIMVTETAIQPSSALDPCGITIVVTETASKAHSALGTSTLTIGGTAIETATNTSTNTSTTTLSPATVSHTGLIVGLAAGFGAVVLLLVGGVLIMLWRRRQARRGGGDEAVALEGLPPSEARHLVQEAPEGTTPPGPQGTAGTAGQHVPQVPAATAAAWRSLTGTRTPVNTPTSQQPSVRAVASGPAPAGPVHDHPQTAASFEGSSLNGSSER